MAAIATVSKTVVQVGRHGKATVPRLVSAVYISKRDESTNLASYKRGRGGRSSFSGVVATVFGATGFVGRYIVNRLGKVGSQVIIPYRGEPLDIQRLKLSGDLGQILFFPYSLRDEESVRKVLQYSNVVINLIGRDWETRNFKYNEVHVESARLVARLARENGVERLIHFSSLNASPNPQQIYIKGGSRFLKTKYAGEEAVREEFPDATIFRPADIFGAEDRFIRYYASVWRRARGTMPLWHKGDATIKQPVFVSDVAEAVIQAIRNPDSVGQTYDAVGPHRYYLADLVDYFYRCMRFQNFKRSYLSPVFRMKTMAMSMAPATPIYTMEKIEKDHVTDILTGNPTLEDLGVNLLRLEDRAPFELKPFRMNAYYDEALGEFADPVPPPVVS
ncbi:NADH dehydrogenase [ubiquinone] 1 alpha subcomplex subunit 9, mitochondrial-like [Haliotis rufescens]|uniref:NADH dehydrogenase [ubiquinone] 1 alpha subcomplex subunit 9, mitochondrial-like n=1 Tax=Haliotis rufescens TaxID=6454 RepID=UPI001EB02366|nr:NADH dehydrogenase [ubiquinone] 1 alpha subcomplex subunit 9, mitochondrial-like [Haliotis rufescens]